MALVDLAGGNVSSWAVPSPEGLCGYRGLSETSQSAGCVLAGWRWPEEPGPIESEAGVTAGVHGYFFGPDQPSSARRLLDTYLERGEKAFSDLDGEFAFVLHDGRTSTLYLGRDSFGTKPLFRCSTGERVVLATELRHILPFLDAPPQLEYDHIRALFEFGWAPTRPWSTVYRGIHRVLPSQILKLSRGAEHRWLTWEPPRTVDRRLDAPTVARLIPEILRRSLRRRRLTKPAFLLSGGLDSPFVAAVAVSDPDTRARFGPRPTALTHVSPGHPVDEAGRSSEVVRHLGLQQITYEVPCDDLGPGISKLLDYCDHPLGLPGPGVLPPLEIARDLGLKTLVGGIGGDTFWHFRPNDVSPWDLAVAPAVAHFLRRFLGSLRFGWRPALSEVMALLRERTIPDPRFTTRTWGSRIGSFHEFCHGIYEGREQVASRFGITYSEPFLDREMANLAFSVHPRHLQRVGQRKRLLALAARDLLPPHFIATWRPVHYSGFLAGALRTQKSPLPAHSQLVLDQASAHSGDFVVGDAPKRFPGDMARYLRFLALTGWLEQRGADRGRCD